jgi:hypothetical protein
MRDRREAEYELFRLALCFTRMGAKEWVGEALSVGQASGTWKARTFISPMKFVTSSAVLPNTTADM